MAWELSTVENQRLNLVKDYINKIENMTNLCLRFNISRKTGYKWLSRYIELGEEGLKNLSKAPREPHSLYKNTQIDIAIDLKLKYRKWGPKKILVKLHELYPTEDWPSQTRLYEIFKEHHLVTKKKIRSRVPATAPLGNAVNSNDTWAVDLKGWFLTGDGQKCEPLTITDNASRYLIKCVYLPKHSVEYVWPVFDEAFREYGLPLHVRSDNGPPFGTTGVGRLSRLSINIIKAGVIPEWIQPGHPEENGRHERFHQTLKLEVASPPKESLSLQIQATSQFEHVYNFERPHEALDMKTPGSCYQNSYRRWDGILRPPEYNTREMDIRKVSTRGAISVFNKMHFLGETLINEYVGLKKCQNGEMEVYYGPIYLGKFANDDFEKPKLNTRRQR